jgi:hypothetical protein
VKKQDQIGWKYQKVRKLSVHCEFRSICGSIEPMQYLNVGCCCHALLLLYCCCTAQVETPHPRPPLYRTFLDTQQYSDVSIALYEAVYGKGFVSPGGQRVSAQLLDGLQLQPGMRLLDVGCGIGGGRLKLCLVCWFVSAAFLVHVALPANPPEKK